MPKRVDEVRLRIERVREGGAALESVSDTLEAESKGGVDGPDELGMTGLVLRSKGRRGRGRKRGVSDMIGVYQGIELNVNGRAYSCWYSRLMRQKIAKVDEQVSKRVVDHQSV